MSPKPWAKLEVGYMDHPKFLALNANAICLWHEGKNYCDKFQTDGLIPRDALKLFRFRGAKAVAMLMAPCGTPKSDGGRYSPLWEDDPVGFRMHDYLDHNDCSDVVLARMEQADRNRGLDREYKAHARAEKKAKRERGPVDVRPDAQPDSPVGVRLYTETESEPETSTTPIGVVTRPRPMAPIYDNSHRKHAHCGRMCLHASLFSDFVRRRNTDNADQEIRDWAMNVEREWGPGGPKAHLETGDMYDFWKARYAEKWPAAAKAERSGPAVLDAEETRKRYFA